MQLYGWHGSGEKDFDYSMMRVRIACLCYSETPEMAVKKVKASDYRHWLLLPKDYNTKKLNVSIEEELRALSASSSADAAAETHTTLADALDTAVETAGAPSEPQDTPVMPNPQS